MTLADLYFALADPTRLRVLEMLHEDARPVHALAAAFDISRPAISRHLRVLKEAGLVKEIKKGRENVYSLQGAKLRPATEWLERHRPAPKPTKAATKAAATKPPRAAKPVAPKVAKAPPKQDIPAPAPAAPQLSFFDL